MYVYLACPLPNSSCYTLCSLVPSMYKQRCSRYVLREIRHSETSVHSDLLFIRPGTRIIFAARSHAQQDGHAQGKRLASELGLYTEVRDTSLLSPPRRERGVHNPTHDGLLGTARRLIVHRSASFSFRRYC